MNESGLNLRVRIAGDEIDKLKKSPAVKIVEPYKRPAFLNDRASGVIGARPLQSPGFAFPGGLTGAGQIVAVADSGLDIGVNNNKMHPDFRTEDGNTTKIVALKSLAGDLVPSDPLGHGTHVAGTVLGSGAASGGKYRGVAPEARLYFQSILDARDQPDPPANLPELFDPAYRAGARIHVNSWGTPENNYTIISSQIDSYVRSHPDFLVVFGAGNSGAGPNGSGTLVAEANSKNALVVGASENPRPGFGPDADRYSDVAAFSSRGPAGDGRIRPELVAPGTSIIS
ncbi:MAG: S8 family serine peptidase, partial [Peptococcaceae bacterium]|nr:S8 family serine peptidase [Peptococcaceae bacterium]